MVTLSYCCNSTHKKQLTDLEALTEPPSGDMVYNRTIYFSEHSEMLLKEVQQHNRECTEFKTIMSTLQPVSLKRQRW